MPTDDKDLKGLTQLGKKAEPSRALEVFPNHAPPGSMTVTLDCQEFTCYCPATHQPDFATIEITYVPDQHIVESKSMKLFLESYREEGVFHEHLAVDLGNKFVQHVQPVSVDVVVKFNVRGGIAISAKYHWTKTGGSVDESAYNLV